MRYDNKGVELNGVEQFWLKVDCKGPDECWLWLEGTWSNGYGRFKINYKSVRAHRYALETTTGEPEHPSLLALHTCHNKLCCNPRHLYWGTHRNNMDDRVARQLPAWNKGLSKQLSVAEYEASWGHVTTEGE